MSSLRAVVFDFDGTLADSYPAITASVNHVRHRHGLPPLAEAEVRKHVGRGPVYLMEHTVPGSKDVQADVACYRAHHPSVMREGTRLLPGVADTLATLHAAGLLLAVCSNKPVAFTRDLLRFLGVADNFTVVLGPEDVPRPKPAPDMLQEALRRLALPREEVLYVGDMVVDIDTARAAGVRVWVVATGSDEPATLRAARPERLLTRFGELATVLLSPGQGRA